MLVGLQVSLLDLLFSSRVLRARSYAERHSKCLLVGTDSIKF